MRCIFSNVVLPMWLYILLNKNYFGYFLFLLFLTIGKCSKFLINIDSFLYIILYRIFS